MKSLIPILVFMLLLSGCHVRFVEGPDSPLAHYVGRKAEFRKKLVIYDHGAFGRLGVPAGEWPVPKKGKAMATLEPGASIEIIEIASRRLESGKHYYLACRYLTAGEEVTFDYPADERFIGSDYIIWK